MTGIPDASAARAFLPGLILQLLLLHPVPAQERIWVSMPDYGNLYPAKQIRYCNGEADPSALQIMQDHYGFIWFGTVNSLIEYDGNRYTAYRVGRNDDKGLAGSLILSLAEDREGNIWAGTYSALNKLDRRTGRFTHYYPDSLDIRGQNNIIRLIGTDRSGMLWLITNRNIFRFDPVSEAFRQFELDSLAWLPTNPAYEWMAMPVEHLFAEDRKGNIFIGTADGLFHFNPATNRHRMLKHVPSNTTDLSGNRVTGLAIDAADRLWVSTFGDGLNRLDQPTGESFTHYRHHQGDANSLVSDTLTTLEITKSGKLLTGGYGCISIMNPATGRFRSCILVDVVKREKAPQIVVDGLFEDNEGCVWIQSRNVGFGKLIFQEKALIFQYLPVIMNLHVILDQAGSFWVGGLTEFAWRIDLQAPRFMHFRYYFVRPWIYEDTRGTIWFPGMIARFNSFMDMSVYEKAKLPADIPFTAMCENANGKLWFGADYLYRYLPGATKMEQFIITGIVRQKVKEGGIRYMTCDAKGNIWFGNRSFLACYDVEKRNAVLVSNAGMKILRDGAWQIEQVLVDAQNTVWVATLEGLCRIEPGRGNRLTRFVYDPFKPGTIGDNAVYRLTLDKLGRLWVVTMGAGIYLFDRQQETFTPVPVFEDFPHIGFYEVIGDHKGNIWFFHGAGISRYDPLTGKLRTYPEPAGNTDMMVDSIRNGVIFMTPGGENGTWVFNSDSLTDNPFIPPVYITSMRIRGREIPDILGMQQPGAPVLRLKHRDNTILMTFTALNYTHPELNHYKYRMIGQEQDTSLAGMGNTAEYRNMPPGKYTFWVTGSNNDGLWNPAGTSVSFVIAPPLSRSVMAWLLYGLLALVAIYRFIRFRTQRLRREKELLEHQVRLRTGQVERQKERLEVQNRQIRELDTLKTRFFTNISHEFRTPLTLIQGPVEEMLAQPGRKRKDRRMLSTVVSNTRRLLNLVNQLLDISKIDSNSMRLSLTEGDVIDFLRTLAASFSSMAETRHINYIIQLPVVNRYVWFDPDNIEKVVTNLLSNAFRFTPAAGTIILSASYTLDDTENPVALHIAVSDTGVGIPADAQDRIFDRFYQVEEHLGREGAGTGLGLSLVKDLVQLMHGTITVRSEPGKGSEFQVWVPVGLHYLKKEEYTLVSRQEPPSFSSRHIPEDLAEGDDMAGDIADHQGSDGLPRVLIVEDNKDIRMHIMDHFRGSFSLSQAADGAEGLKAALETMPDLVIADLMMPHMDGTEMCQKLKADERTSHIPLIMLTAKAGMEDRLNGLVAGADDYLSKPFNMQELYLRSVNLIEGRKKLRERFAKEVGVQPGDITVNARDEAFLKRAIALVENHLSDEFFTVEAFCAGMNMSHSTLFRKLYAITSQSPVEFITTIRLKKAAELLHQKRGNISEIALEVGFSNPSYFARLFRKKFGISPRDYFK